MSYFLSTCLSTSCDMPPAGGPARCEALYSLGLGRVRGGGLARAAPQSCSKQELRGTPRRHETAAVGRFARTHYIVVGARDVTTAGRPVVFGVASLRPSHLGSACALPCAYVLASTSSRRERRSAENSAMLYPAISPAFGVLRDACGGTADGDNKATNESSRSGGVLVAQHSSR